MATPSLPHRNIASLKMNPEHLELLVTRVMPYGKYKGRLIADLPGHYLNWFASQGFPPGEIGRLTRFCASVVIATICPVLALVLLSSDPA
jgi:uncharacterized protein (DUF3820 family)